MTERDLFVEARELPTAARSAFLNEACGTDAALRERLEMLLAADVESHPILDAAMVNLQSLLSTANTNATPSLAGYDRSDLGGRLGHFELIEVIGRGGFGVVYRALDTVLRRTVAVKVLHPLVAVHTPSRNRFLREAQAAAAVRHQNVVQVYAVEEEPQPYLVMEHIAGETLQQRLDQQGRLDWSEVVGIARQVATGLAAAHAVGLVHRDVKPANVLVESKTDRVLVSDFGLAWAVDDASLSQQGVAAGTPLYMSPEQARGERPDHRGDLFSLGSVLYAALTGRPPFAAPHTLAVLKRVAEHTPDPLGELAPSWLAAIVAKLLAKDPADRFASADEFIAALDRHDSPALKRRPLRPSIPAALVALAVVAVLVVAAWQIFVPKTDPNHNAELTQAAAEAQEAIRRERYHTETSLLLRTLDTPGQEKRLAEYVANWEARAGDLDLRGWEWQLIRNMANPVARTLRCVTSTHTIDFTRDGQTIVGSGTRELHLISPKTGEPKGEWPTLLTTDVGVFRREPAGDRYLLADPNLVAVFHPKSGERWSRPLSPFKASRRVAWDPTGARVAYRNDISSCRIADAATGAEVRTLSGVDEAFAFNHNGTRFAAVAWPKGNAAPPVLQVWRTGDWAVEHTSALKGNEKPTILSWSPDGRTLAIGDAHGSVQLYDPVARTMRRILLDNGGFIHSAAWRPDGQWFAVGDDGGHVRVWETATWEEVPLCRGATGVITSLSWRPDGAELAAGINARQTIYVWDMTRPPVQRSFRVTTDLPNTRYLPSCAWHPDGQRLAGSMRNHSTIVWGANGFEAERSDCVQWHWTRDGKHTASVRGESVEVRVVAGAVVAKVILHGQPKIVAWHPAGDVLAVRVARRIFLWKPFTQEPPELVFGQPNTDERIDYEPGGGLAWSPDGLFLAFGVPKKPGGPWQVQILNATERRVIATFSEQASVIQAVAWSPDGTQVVVVGDDPRVRVLDAATGAEVKQLAGHARAVHTVALHPSGTRIATGSDDGTVKIWDAGGWPTVTLDTGAAVRHVAWTADGAGLAAAVEDGTIRIWNAGQ